MFSMTAQLPYIRSSSISYRRNTRSMKMMKGIMVFTVRKMRQVWTGGYHTSAWHGVPFIRYKPKSVPISGRVMGGGGKGHNLPVPLLLTYTSSTQQPLIKLRPLIFGMELPLPLPFHCKSPGSALSTFQILRNSNK